MKFYEAINERAELLKQYGSLGQRFKKRGYNLVVIDEGDPQDVHGKPKHLNAYGRAWIKNGALHVEGGYGGHREGHPRNIDYGFFWALDLDARRKDNTGQVREVGTIYLKGRGSTRIPNNDRFVNLFLKEIYKHT